MCSSTCRRAASLSITALLVLPIGVFAQTKRIPEYKRFFQVSMFPGISTNGLTSGSFRNTISINLFGGISAGNRVLELGLLTNANMKEVSGIQIAGLANIIGANAFINLTAMEERDMIKEGFECSNKGIQVAGLLNYVRDNSHTIQATAGLNVVGLNFRGFQLAGIGNSAGGYVGGAQVAGIYNIAHESMAGFQVSTSFNYTSGQLSGLQLALVNKAVKIDGRNSSPRTSARGMQLGIVNLSREMNGRQVGLINFGGAMRGNQIGLINFFKKVPTKENLRLGTPIGLLNFGSVGSVKRLYMNDLFLANFEYTTGNCLNCSVGGMGKSDMPFNENWKKLNQNALILGFDPRYDTWGFGYGFMRILLNKVVMIDKPDAPRNARKMISYGARIMHLNRSMSYDNSFNLLTRLQVDFGYKRKFLPRIFGGVSLNYFAHESMDVHNDYHIAAPVVTFGSGKILSSMWPGYSLGLQFDPGR